MSGKDLIIFKNIIIFQLITSTTKPRQLSVPTEHLLLFKKQKQVFYGEQEAGIQFY
jgi:hypothetical protein